MDINVAHLPTHKAGYSAPIWWGQLLMMSIEGVLFAILTAGYCYVRVNFAVWPPPGIENPRVTIPIIGLVVLLISAIPMIWADKALKKKDRNGVLLGLILNAALAVVFLGIRWYEFLALNFKWNTNIYGSFVWSLLGLHTMHTIADLLETFVFIGIILVRRVGEKQEEGLETDSFYWGFVIVTWIPVFFLVYVYPHLAKPF